MNVEDILKEHKISYETKGENISSGWIAVKCPFCSDHLAHCGISPDREIFSCWRCGEKGPVDKLISKLIKQPRKIVSKLLNKQDANKNTFLEKKALKTNPRASKTILEKYLQTHFSEVLTESCYRYLKSRYFHPEFLWGKYKLLSTNPVSDFKFRIGIPIFNGGEIENLVARDISGYSDKRYKNLPNDLSGTNIKNCLYNLDNCTRDNVLVVEGPFDVFRMGDNCCAVLGVQFTQAQIKQLRRFKNVFIMFDPEATKRASELGDALSPFCHVEVIKIGVERDPAEFIESEVNLIRRELKL